jgi:uncharacterized protein YkwD
MWLFVLGFSVVGTYFLVTTFANPKLPTYSDDIVAGYINLTPTVVSQDEAGNLAYEMYPATAYVQVDGTVVCDSGGSSGTVTTGTLSNGQVKQLHKDMYDSGVTDLADEVGSGANDAFVSYEGVLVGSEGEAKGTAVYGDAQRPDSFTNAKDKITKACEKATRTANRGEVASPREPNMKKTNNKKTAFTDLEELVFPKASACCSAGVTEDKTFESAHYNSINQWRTQNGRRTLPHDGCMGDKATMYSNTMASTGRFVHSTRIAADADACRKGWRKLGENIGKGYDNSSLMNAFKASSGHNINMLDSAWTQMGIGAVYVKDSAGRRLYYVTQRYGQY